MNEFLTEDELFEIGLVAIIRADFEADLYRAAQALAAGKVRAMEITLNTPGALSAISEIRKGLSPTIRVGAGTVLGIEDVKVAYDAGAEFIVTPTLQMDTIAFCREHSLPIYCGCMTPTEALSAHKAGANFIKLFPADTLGPEYVKAILAPLPFLKIVPTGGVSLHNISAYIRAGSAGVALGSNLASKQRLREGDWDGLTASAREFSQSLAEARAAMEGKSTL